MKAFATIAIICILSGCVRTVYVDRPVEVIREVPVYPQPGDSDELDALIEYLINHCVIEE